MHFKMETKVNHNNFFSTFVCQNWSNHISKMLDLEPVGAICGCDHPSKCYNVYDSANPHFHSDNCLPFGFVYCIIYLSKHHTLGKNAKFSMKCTIQVLQTTTEATKSVIALMHAKITDFLLHSRLYLDHYIYDEGLILAVVSEIDGPTKIGCLQVSSANMEVAC